MSFSLSLSKILVSESITPSPIRLGTSWMKVGKLPAGAALEFDVSEVKNCQFLVDGQAATEFTWAQLKKGQVSLLHDGSSQSPGFSLKGRLGEDSVTVFSSEANLSFRPTNDKAAITQKDFVLDEGGELNLRSMISLHDEEDAAAGILGKAVYTAKATGGKIYVGWQLLDGKTFKSFTQEQVENGQVRFVHDGSEKRPSLSLSVTDSEGLSTKKQIDFSGAAFQNLNDAARVLSNRITLEEGVDVRVGKLLTITDSDSRVNDCVIHLENASDYLLKVDGQEAHSFTYGQMREGKVQLRLLNHHQAPNLFYTVDDGEGGVTSGSLSIAVKNSEVKKHDKPQVEAAAPLILVDGGSRVLDDSFFHVIDPLTPPSGVLISPVGVVNGSFRIAGKTVGSFTWQDLKDGLVSFIHTPKPGNPEPRFNLKFSYLEGGSDVLHGNLVIDLRQPPSLLSPTQLSLNEDESVDGVISASGDGVGSLSYAIVSEAKHGALTLVGNSYSYTPDEDYNGVDSFVLSVSTSYGAVSTQTVKVVISAVNDAVEGEVQISGVLSRGGLLHADASGLQDVDGLGSLHFQWLRDGVEINGADESSYLLRAEDVGHSLSVAVSFVDGNGHQEFAAAAPTELIANDNHAAEGVVTFSGDCQVGQVLFAGSEIEDEDGFGGSVTYTWFDEAGNVLGQGDSLLLTEELVGLRLHVTASFVDGMGNDEAISSESSAPVSPSIECQAPLRLGAEIQIDPDSLYDQWGSKICSLENGNWLVTWSENFQYDTDHPSIRIYQQLIDADGMRIGGKTLVNAEPHGYDLNPVVCSLEDGGWVVTWTAETNDSLPWRSQIYQQRFDQNGDALGSAAVVNGIPADFLSEADCIGLEDGGWLVTWTSYNQDGSGKDIYQQRFAKDGAAAGDEVLVNTSVMNHQDNSSVSLLADGGWLVTWQSFNEDGSLEGIYQQRFTEDGVKAGDENLVARGANALPEIAGLADGGWVVLWGSSDLAPFLDSEFEVLQQRYDRNGAPLGDICIVSTGLPGDQYSPRVASLPDGGWIVVIQSSSAPDYQSHVYLQAFASDGTKSGGEILVSGHLLEQWNPDLAASSDGSWMTTWLEVVATANGVQTQVMAQRYQMEDCHDNTAPSGTLSIQGNPVLGQTLFADNAISDADGIGTITLTWYDSSGNIVGIGDTLLLTEELLGERIHLTATYVDGRGTVEQIRSQDTGEIAQPIDNSPATGSVSIDGVPLQGQTLVASHNIEDADGLGEITYTWYDQNGNSVGQGASLLLSTDLVGMNLHVDASFVDGRGNAESISSDLLDFVRMLPGTAASASNLTLGAEFQVNSFIPEDQARAKSIPLADGGFLVTWVSWHQDTAGYGIYAQRYSAQGQAVGNEFQVSSDYPSDQDYSSVCALANGGWAIAWASFGQDGSGWGVFARVYDGQSQSSEEFQVNSTSSGNQSQPSLSALQDGFVISWIQEGENPGVYAQGFNTDGSTRGNEFQVNSQPSSMVTQSVSTQLDNGDIVMIWSSYGQDGSEWGIFGQRFTPDLSSVGPEFQINTFTEDCQFYPAIYALGDGGFLVAWTSQQQDGTNSGVYAQRYNAEGHRVGEEFQVCANPVGDQWLPSIAKLSDGGFLISWTSDLRDGDSFAICAQRYAADGSRVGSEFLVNEYTASYQAGSNAISLQDGSLLLTWHSFGQDGSDSGVFARQIFAEYSSETPGFVPSVPELV
ncbi:MAG: hypothetical protein RL095_3499 [Verrucomicrobiota bacterium]|jgi:hypothetical protein